jgi:hypothetical protein
MQKTNLTLDEIVGQMANGSQYPQCFLANELGALAKESKDPKAIMALGGLLKSTDKKVQYPAYAYLSTFLAFQPGIDAIIKAFEADPENLELVRAFATRNETKAALVQ